MNQSLKRLGMCPEGRS